jgi:hypothetical protein
MQFTIGSSVAKQSCLCIQIIFFLVGLVMPLEARGISWRFVGSVATLTQFNA